MAQAPPQLLEAVLVDPHGYTPEQARRAVGVWVRVRPADSVCKDDIGACLSIAEASAARHE